MWLYLAVLVVLYYLLRWYQEKQVVSHLRDKFVFIMGCDSGFGNQLARQLDLRGLRVLAACLMEQGAEQLRNQTSDRLETVILDVTKTESVAVATEWVKERVGDRVGAVINVDGEEMLRALTLAPSAPAPLTSSTPLVVQPRYWMQLLRWYQERQWVKECVGDRVMKSVDLLETTCCQDLSLVTECMKHALTACHPRTQYSPGWDAKFIYLPMSYLPSFLVDLMVYWRNPQPAKAL
ncbi:retinol dehydrogenase 16-like [Capricornis sumatraensis]|uniref:retinol dehydrogenase 16-like n=1 Tax=Capricornis sumatraensis TaxID=34865 RepID=UPI003604DB73